MRLHDRWTCVVVTLALLLCTSMPAFAADSTSNASKNTEPVWKDGELAPPLPEDPAARAAALDQAANNAAPWTAPPGTRSVMYAGAVASVTVQAIPVTPVPGLAPVAGGADMDRWLQELQSRLRPLDASSKQKAGAPIEAGESSGTINSQGPSLAPSLLSSFEGIDDTGLRPAAPDIAVGPNHILLATTDRLAVMDKCGNTLLTYTLRDFGALPATRAYYTPRVIYDEWNNRWIMVFIGTETNYSASALYAFFTTGPDPTGGWERYELVNPPNFPGLKDFPGVSATPDGVYITWDRFNLGTFVFETAVLIEMDRSDFYDGGSTGVSIRTGMTNPNNGTLAFSIRPAQMHTYGGTVYFVDTDAFGDDFLTLWRLAGVPFSSVLTGFDIAIGAYIPPLDVAQIDGTLLDTGDCRVLDAAYSSGHLYETHDQQLGGAPVVTVTYVDTGDFDHYKYSTSTAVGYANCYGAIDVDANDQVALVYSAWGGGALEPSLYYRFLTFPPGSSLGAGTLVFGQDSFNSGSQPYPWGPYAGCARDPIDGRTMWVYGMYASDSPLNSWATRVGAVTMFAPSQLEVIPTDPYYFSIYYTGGFVGGPFSRDVFTYDLQNTGQTAANWLLTGVPSWLTAVESIGHVGPGETQTVTLHLSSSAYTLPEGEYSTYLSFQNCTGSGSQPEFIGLGIGHDGSCTGGELALYPTHATPNISGSQPAPGMYITAMEDMNVCAVEVTAQLVAIPQVVWARVYEANGVTRGPLIAETFYELVLPGNVKHSIPLAVALEACKDYEVSVEFTDEYIYDAFNESSLYLPSDIGGVVRLRNASAGGSPAGNDVAQIQLVTAVGPCDAASIVDLGGSKGVAALASPDVGMFVQARRTVRLCSVAMNFGAAAGTKVTARVYALDGDTRDYIIAEGSAVVSLPYLNYVEVPISAQLMGGSVYDVAVQVQGMAFYEVNTTGSTPYLIDGVFNVTEGELGGVGPDAVPTLRFGWTEDQAGVHFTLGKPAGPYPPPLSLGSPLSQGAFVTSLINQEVYGLGVYADVPAGNFILAGIYHATGTTRGSLMALASVMSDASGPRWHDVPLAASLVAGTDYDIAVSAPITSAPAWLDAPGLPFDVAGVIRIRDAEKDGVASNDKLIYMRLNACNDTATPVADVPVRTPMFLAPPVPNPASGQVRLGYTVERPGRAEIAVYDVTGRAVANVLAVENARPGAAEASLDASKLASGVYFVRLTTPTGMVARKLVVAH